MSEVERTRRAQLHETLARADVLDFRTASAPEIAEDHGRLTEALRAALRRLEEVDPHGEHEVRP